MQQFSDKLTVNGVPTPATCVWIGVFRQSNKAINDSFFGNDGVFWQRFVPVTGASARLMPRQPSCHGTDEGQSGL